MRTRPFKIASAARWRPSTFVTSLTKCVFILLSACATHQTETLSPLLHRVHKNPIRDCEAEAKLHAETGDQSLTADVRLAFQLRGSRSKAELHILNSLYMTVAKLDVDGDKVRWFDQEGEKNIADQPLFTKWFQTSWWHEISFLFSIPLVETQGHIQQDARGRPKVLSRGVRILECFYDAESTAPTYCEIKDDGFFAKLNFASAECRSPVK